MREFLSSVVPSVEAPTPSDGIFWLSLVLGLAAALIGIGIAWMRYGAREPSFAPSRNPLVTLLEHRYYIDDLYDAVLCDQLSRLACSCSVGLRTRLSTVARAVWAGWSAQTGTGLRALQTGYARNYALAIFFGAALILLFYVIRP